MLATCHKMSHVVGVVAVHLATATYCNSYVGHLLLYPCSLSFSLLSIFVVVLHHPSLSSLIAVCLSIVIFISIHLCFCLSSPSTSIFIHQNPYTSSCIVALNLHCHPLQSACLLSFRLVSISGFAINLNT